MYDTQRYNDRQPFDKIYSQHVKMLQKLVKVYTHRTRHSAAQLIPIAETTDKHSSVLTMLSHQLCCITIEKTALQGEMSLKIAGFNGTSGKMDSSVVEWFTTDKLDADAESHMKLP
jgi:hypothetical protein